MKSFVLIDKNNNIQRNANMVIKFNFEGKDYLVYSVAENDQNSQIMVSKLILNSEGKYFIDNIANEDKGKLSNIVYNIVILLPTETMKGNSFEQLVKNFSSKYFAKLSYDLPLLDVQEYYANSSIAITSNLLVNSAIKLYENNLRVSAPQMPTWTAPVEVTAPIEASVDEKKETINIANPVPTPVLSVQEPMVMPNLEIHNVPQVQNTVKNDTASVSVNLNGSVNQEVVQTNPQVEKLAIVSDPSLGIGVQQPNVGKNKKAGFANTKYVVIGSVCLVLAVLVVIAAYILITNFVE